MHWYGFGFTSWQGFVVILHVNHGLQHYGTRVLDRSLVGTLRALLGLQAAQFCM